MTRRSLSLFVADHRPVPGPLSSLLHMRNRHRQPLPASLPGTLPDPAMQGASAQHMPVSIEGQLLTHIHFYSDMHALLLIDAGTVGKVVKLEIFMADRKIHFTLVDELMKSVKLLMDVTLRGTLYTWGYVCTAVFSCHG